MHDSLARRLKRVFRCRGFEGEAWMGWDGLDGIFVGWLVGKHRWDGWMVGWLLLIFIKKEKTMILRYGEGRRTFMFGFSIGLVRLQRSFVMFFFKRAKLTTATFGDFRIFQAEFANFKLK